MAVQMMSGFIGILQRKESLRQSGWQQWFREKRHPRRPDQVIRGPGVRQLGCRQSHPNVQYDFRAEESDRWGSLRS